MIDNMIEKYRNVVNILRNISLYDNIFADHYHELSDIATIKESGLYLEQAEEGRLSSVKVKIADVTAVIDKKCDIVIEECWTKSDVYSIKKAYDNILKCRWLRIAPIQEFGWYKLFNPYLFILKGDDIKDDVIITPSAKPVPIGRWTVCECYIDDFKNRYREYYLMDKYPNHQEEQS